MPIGGIALILILGCSEGPPPITNGSDFTDNPSSDTSIARPPIPLTKDLCSQPEAIAQVLTRVHPGDGTPSFGDIDQEQVQRMLADPTEGPFYMVNLIHYRDNALYPDGRETDLTGREANALYSPIEFLAAIGARIIYHAEVSQQIDGDETIWDDVAIVEYPCPLAFFAMISDPDFIARSGHKDAGVESTYVLVSHRMPASPSEQPTDSPFSATDEDQAFDLVHVMDLRDEAQYEAELLEPDRSGQEAWDLYWSLSLEAANALGVSVTARFAVQGAFIGDARSWDEVVILNMPSQSGYQAWLENETRQAADFHRRAALQYRYSMITSPMLVDIPGGNPDSGLEITEDGVGTPCQSDTDCPGKGVAKCIIDEDVSGFCTRENCSVGECQGTYQCCYDCAEFAMSLLPFTGSACLPALAISQLTSPPVSCTCE